jgi:hypothetical protein
MEFVNSQGTHKWNFFLKAKNCGGCPHSTSFFKLMEKRVQTYNRELTVSI